MSKMSSVVMHIYELLMDGLDDYEIAEIIANQYSIDEDFAFSLIEEILEGHYIHPTERKIGDSI